MPRKFVINMYIAIPWFCEFTCLGQHTLNSLDQVYLLVYVVAKFVKSALVGKLFFCVCNNYLTLITLWMCYECLITMLYFHFEFWKGLSYHNMGSVLIELYHSFLVIRLGCKATKYEYRAGVK